MNSGRGVGSISFNKQLTQKAENLDMAALSVFRRARKALFKTPSLPLEFPAAGFQLIPEARVLEEEGLEAFRTGNYYPVTVGDIYDSKYQVLGKLGYGTTSTVWLARNLE